MIISHSHKAVFIKTKKTAGTSIEVYMSDYMGPDDILTPVGAEEATEGHHPQNYRGLWNPLPEVLEIGGAGERWRRECGGPFKSIAQLGKTRKFYNHIPAYRVSKRVPKNLWQDYLVFTVERNPWDKALSQFYWKARRRTGYTFKQFIEEGDVGVNYPRYCHPKTGDILVDYIIYYHELNEGLGRVFEHLGIPYSGSLDVRAKTGTRKNRTPYQELFTGELSAYRGAIDALCAPEIELHGWDFDSGKASRKWQLG
ncbi:MAG: hypothetical protein K9L66_06330 [Spirochaetaceae bacterium]|nr:hypothetical protein [Spirochaetaceae bacterium]